MHIGLIGGIGPAATDYYYRRLIATYAQSQRSLELTIVHADAATLLRHLASNDAAAQTAIYRRLTERLVRAGAGCVAVTSIAGHFCIDAFQSVSPLPVVDMVSAVSLAIQARGYKRIGILGTRTVMESHFYGQLPSVQVLPPGGEELEAVHQAYVAMATAGFVTPGQRAVFERASCGLLEEHGAQAILLAGTDLALVFHEASLEFPVIDCAAIHADAIARLD
jgi:aspartate racemase